MIIEMKNHKNKLTKTFILLFLILAVSFSCKKTPTSPWEYPEFTEALETQNFIFHYSQGDNVEPAWQEAFHEWTIGQLEVSIPKKIDYYKYWNVAHTEALTGKSPCWSDSKNFAVHTIYPGDNHECVHLYTSLIGQPSDFFNEGIAVAFSTDPYNGDYVAKWRGESVHYWAKKFKNEGTLIPLNSMLEANDFRRYDGRITYPESGSFVSFMIDTYGIYKMKSIFQAGARMDSKEVIKQKFQSIYGFSIEQAENEWLIFLDSY